MPDQTTIILTRPEAQAKRFAKRLEGLGVRIVLAPILKIVPVANVVAPDGDIPLVITSRSAMELAAPMLNGREVYVVGRGSADLATRHGAKVAGCAETAQELVGMLFRSKPEKLVYLRGEHVVTDLAVTLNSAGIETISKVIYAQEELDMLQEARALIAGVGHVILPVFSPRSARLLSAQIAGIPPGARLHVISLSARVRDNWGSGVLAQHYLAAAPDADAMIEEIRRVVALAG